MKRLWRQQRGDTIVEVLIVLAILGSAMGISYATANRSLIATTRSEQAAQATALLQSQVESLRSLAPNAPPNPNVIYIPGPYCLSAPPVTVITVPANCVFNNRYTVSIMYNSVTGTFTLGATWQQLGSSDTATSTIYYRIYTDD